MVEVHAHHIGYCVLYRFKLWPALPHTEVFSFSCITLLMSSHVSGGQESEKKHSMILFLKVSNSELLPISVTLAFIAFCCNTETV